MAERRMAEVMGQRDSFAEFFVQVKRFANRSGDLGNFNTMCQPCAVILALVVGKHLGFPVQTTECRRMDQPVPVTLKRRADDIRKIRIQTAPAFFRS